MADVLSNYRTGDAFDEMMDAEGSVRPRTRPFTPPSADQPQTISV